MNITGRSLRMAVVKVRSTTGVIAAGVVLTVSTSAFGAETLKQVVEATLKSHPRVLEASSQYRAAGHDVTQARSGYFPTVDLNVAGGSERTDSPTTRALGAGTPQLTRREAGLLVTQNLYNGKATTSEIERQKARLESTASRLAEVREEVALRVTELFIEVIKNRALVRLADENLKAHLATQEKVRQRVQGGISQKTDLQQAMGRVALARSIVSARAGRLREVEANYVSVAGRPAGELDAPVIKPASVVAAGTIDANQLLQSIKQNSASALTSNPSLTGANADLAAAEASLRGAKAPYLPSVNLELGINRNENIGGTRGEAYTDALMLTMRWNLFRGGADAAQERALADRRYAAIDVVANTRREVQERVAVAIHAKATSEERLAFLREHASISADVLSSYQQQLELGRRTLLDVLNAESELFTARSNLVAGQYEDVFNFYSVEAAKGILTKSLGISSAD